MKLQKIMIERRSRKPTRNNKSRNDFRPSLEYFTHFDNETKSMLKSMAE